MVQGTIVKGVRLPSRLWQDLDKMAGQLGKSRNKTIEMLLSAEAYNKELAECEAVRKEVSDG